MNMVSPPTFGRASFSCPFCGAVAHQDWYKLAPIAHEKPPVLPTAPIFSELLRDHRLTQDGQAKIKDLAEKSLSGKVFFQSASDLEDDELLVGNLNLARCFSCREISVWVHSRLIHPEHNFIEEANPDLPSQIRRDFEEASRIVDASPRSSAALLRLCIQKLCIHLGKKGSNLNDDIMELVKDGLSSKIQKALDVVRVIGNNAVHPGEINLDDNAELARSLFKLVNMIAEAMISQPKHVEQLFSDLPEGAKRAIETRGASK